MRPSNIYDAFTSKPTLLDSLKKTDLLALAQYYKLSINTTQKKGDVKKLVQEYLIDEVLVPEEETESLEPSTALLELKRLEFQERESQLRLKELEVHEKELSIQLKLKE